MSPTTSAAASPGASPAASEGPDLARKLGIRAGHRVLLLAPPAGFSLDPLPLDVVVHRRRGRTWYDVAVVFCPDAQSMLARVGAVVGLLPPAGAVWICWPKKASGLPTDLSDAAVRAFGLSTGLVDVKVAAIDTTWSGLRFVRRVTDR